MKKHIILSSIVVTIMSFLFMIPHFNAEVDYNFNYMHNYINNGQYVMMVDIAENESIANVDYREFHKNLDDCAIKNNLVMVQYTIADDEEVRKETMYLSSNDLYAQDVFLLKKGTLDSKSNQRYSTISENPETKLVSLFSPTVYEIDSLLNSTDNTAGYSMANLSGDIEENFSNFISDMDQLYPGIIIHNARTFTESMSKVAVDDLLIIKTLCVSIIMLIMCSKLFSLQKTISIYKIEGYSNLKIYVKLFLKPFILVNCMCFSLSLLLILYCFQSGLTFKVMSGLYSQQFLLLLVLQILLSLIVYLIIAYVPKVSSIKGKNELPKIQKCAFILKIVIVILISPIISNKFMPAVDFIKMNLRYDKVVQELENYYNFGAHINSNYHLARGSDNYISLSKDLEHNNNRFELSKAAYFDFENFDPNNINYFYSADVSYLRLVGLADEKFDENQVYIFTKPNNSYDLDLLRKDILKNTTKDPVFNYVEYEKNLKSYDTRTLLFKDEIDNLPIVYMPVEKQFRGQLNTSVFYYDNDTIPVQEYIDYIFKAHGYTPGFSIDSMASNYSAVFQGYLGLSIQSFMQFVIALFAYIAATIFLFEIDLDNNMRRYQISFIEGANVYKFKTYALKFISASVIGLTITVAVMPKIVNKDFVSCLIFITVVELIMYGLFIYRCRKRK